MEDFSMISPNTITVDLVDIHAYLKPSVEQQQQQQSSLDELAAFEGDPLEWLIETGVAAEDDDERNGGESLLPESSLPFFPELNKDKVVGQQEQQQQEQDSTIEEQAHCAPMVTASETMVEDAISNNMVDPNVTVQSLFLPCETTGLP